MALSLRAERAADYFQLPGLDTHGQPLDNTPASDGDELQLARVGFGGGVASAFDVAQAQTKYRTVKAQEIDVGVARAQLEHAIASLIGVPAGSDARTS